MLESGNAVTSIDLHPSSGYSSSMATSTDDVEQCGYAYSSLGGGNHAVKWSGSAASFLDLHSSTGFTWSYCLGTHGGQQVGFGERPVYFTTYQHAIVWNGNVATDLHPLAPYGYTKAHGVRSGQQVGYGSSVPYPHNDGVGYHTSSRALLWTGSAASVVDLHPAAFTASEALATNGTQQGGWVYTAIPASQHAALWSGTADTFIDLHPAGYSDSRITALTATQQVGDGWVGPMGAAGSVRHALVWTGTPGSVIDLNQYLPPGYTHAVATGIDPNGNVVGYAYNTPTSGLTMPPDAIAVVFAPGAVAPAALASLTLSPSSPAPGTTVQGTVTLGGPAPASGVTVTFLSGNAALLPAPGALIIPAGQSSATFTLPAGGATLQAPAFAKLYVTDGASSRSASVTVTPIVNVTGISVNPVEGGFATRGTVTLSIPAQAGGATVTLTSANPLLTLPASITIPAGSSTYGFSVTTGAVTTATTIPVSATYKGITVSSSVTLSPAPVVAVAAVTVPTSVVGGQSFTGTVTVTNYPRNVEGVVITLTSGDARTVTLPATVTIPQYATSVTFTASTVVVTGAKGVSIKAAFGSSNITANTSIIPIPTITITQADYLTDLGMLKVAVTTTLTGATFTFGTSPLGPAIGTMQLELGQYKGATLMATAPAQITVWSSDGGTATMAVTQKLSSGGGGGGGGSTTTAAKLTINRAGKGTIFSNPAGITCGAGSGGCSASFTTNTSVTLTATPDAGAAWLGWGGACSGTSLTCTVVMSADKSVIANFK